jgi:hypothetical protein
MDIDDKFKLLRSLYQTITSKSDVDVMLMYRGESPGVDPYLLRIDSREVKGQTVEIVVNALFVLLKKELADKVKSAEKEVKRLNSVLHQLDN